MNAEVIVVGGGVNGLWTACHLAEQGIKSMVFDQFPIPHTQGSSHGQSRLTWSSRVEQVYAALMPECHRNWKALEKQTGRQLFLDIGVLSLYNKNERSAEVESMVKNCEQLKIKHKVFSGENLSKNFPGLVSGSENVCFLDEEGGLLKAGTCILALMEWFQKMGGIVHDGEPVLSLNVVSEEKVEVKTAKKKYLCKSVVLACGPYTNTLLSTLDLQLPIKAIRALVYYWKDKTGYKYSISENFPGTIVHPYGHAFFYSTPAYEYPGLMKICCHRETFVDPYQRDRITEQDEMAEKEKLDWLKSEIRKWFPDIDATAPAINEVCTLTKSPDKNFILDFHPKYKNVVFGTGFSGRGFKTAPAIGKMLAAMATNRSTSYSLEPFLLKRFKYTHAKKI